MGWGGSVGGVRGGEGGGGGGGGGGVVLEMGVGVRVGRGWWSDQLGKGCLSSYIFILGHVPIRTWLLSYHGVMTQLTREKQLVLLPKRLVRQMDLDAGLRTRAALLDLIAESCASPFLVFALGSDWGWRLGLALVLCWGGLGVELVLVVGLGWVGGLALVFVQGWG